MSTFPNPNAAEPFALPPAPSSLAGPVKAWSEAVQVLSQINSGRNQNPFFSPAGQEGETYPVPALEPATVDASVRGTEAIHIENEYLRLLMLPSAGGGLLVGYDKAAGREFLQRSALLKNGSSLGLQVRWPHASTSAALSFATYIEEHPDGSRTAWYSTFDPYTRCKGMHGFCLYPGRAYVELKVRLYNRTPFVQAFDWSASAVLPSDIAGEVIPFPNADGEVGPGFFGAYNTATKAGLAVVADRQLFDGRELIGQRDGAILRAGLSASSEQKVSTIAPFETKVFHQIWIPFSGLGAPQKANADAAIRLSIADESVLAGACVTRSFDNAAVLLTSESTVLARWTRDLTPGQVLLEEATLPQDVKPSTVTLRVLTAAGRELISYTPAAPVEQPSPEAAAAARPAIDVAPKKVGTLEELFLAGLRVQHQKLPSYRAEEYWREALRRDPHHASSNNAIGLLQLTRGEFEEAEAHIRRALATVALSRSTALEGELFYSLGLVLAYQDRAGEAHAAFQKASWTFAWRSPALQAAAELDCKRHEFGIVPKSLYEALRLNADNNNARSLAVVLFRRFGRTQEAEQLIRESLLLDPLDPWACQLSGRPFPGNNQVRLDVAFDYARAGLYEPAIELLTAADTFARDGSMPMVHYALAAFYMLTGDFAAAQREYLAGAQTQPDFCFPHRLEEMLVLVRAIAVQPEDARAQYYLGNLLYYRGLPAQALELWQSAVKLEPNFATAWRNLAVGHFNSGDNSEAALDAYDRALAANPQDAQIFFERDQLWKRLGVPPALRLREMQEHLAQVESNERLALELAGLYNSTGEPERALSLFSSGRLPGWETDPRGIEEYVRTFVKLGRQALVMGDTDRARDLLLLALSSSPLKGANADRRAAELQFWLGEALHEEGQQEAALVYWQQAAAPYSVPPPRPPFSESTFFGGLALARIGERQLSRRIFRELWFGARRMAREKSGMPDPLPFTPFKQQAERAQRVHGLLLQAQARVGLGQNKLAARVLQQLLALDPNNGRGLDLTVDLEAAAAKALQ